MGTINPPAEKESQTSSWPLTNRFMRPTGTESNPEGYSHVSPWRFKTAAHNDIFLQIDTAKWPGRVICMPSMHLSDAKIMRGLTAGNSFSGKSRELGSNTLNSQHSRFSCYPPMRGETPRLTAGGKHAMARNKQRNRIPAQCLPNGSGC